ncbi:hypothetical protein [Acuticoccus mangrovi]|uniref:Uncharacterized protein n=1 Tax=Acuticoccus mangrovi TaxID=2796142 RepID=A0A934MBH2_9HYPH|nr:hypothetical protein [Acuticoccus mangrovi]MBJ3774117.1 hypothetical protein [Acuticoccus mangrovi]
MTAKRKGPTRRAALGWLAAGASLLTGRVAAAPASPERRLARLAGSRRAAGRIGRAYLADRGGADLSALMAEIEARTALSSDAVMRLSPDALAARLAVAKREDFERRDTVAVEGWVLSGTEARLCALATLV